MTYQLALLPLAELDILEAAAYYEEQREGLGSEFLDELEKAKTKLSKHPSFYSYISVDKSLRSFSLNRFPFKLIYEIYGNRVIINAVRHDKRKPLR